jgi:hypothetical protein
MPTLRTYEVLGDSGELEHVSLEPRASRVDVERALSSVGYYVPRGADELEWYSDCFAVIRTCDGELVHLRAADEVWFKHLKQDLRWAPEGWRGGVHPALCAPVSNDNGERWGWP